MLSLDTIDQQLSDFKRTSLGFIARAVFAADPSVGIGAAWILGFGSRRGKNQRRDRVVLHFVSDVVSLIDMVSYRISTRSLAVRVRAEQTKNSPAVGCPGEEKKEKGKKKKKRKRKRRKKRKPCRETSLTSFLILV